MRLETELRGDRQLVVRRHIAAPPERVYAAHTEDALIRQWLLGPPGTEMPVCKHDLRPGGRFRMRWRGEGFPEFEITGEYIALDPPHRIEHVERMHLPAGATEDNHIVTSFAPDGAGGTRMEMVMTFASGAARKAALASGMTDGMEQCYDRLDTL